MASLAHHAEILKLARLLDADAESLAFLEKLEVRTIRQLRERATASLFDADSHLFHRLAAATKLLPASVAALIAEKALGDLLCARVAGLLPAERAVDIARRLHTGFLADVCLEIDPRHVRDLIAQMPIPRTVEVALELARRREHITMGRFVDCLPPATMRAILDALTDDEALLRIGFFVEDPRRLSAVIGMLSHERLRNMILVAVNADAELWGEALTLINSVEAPQRRTMAACAATLDRTVIQRMIALTQNGGLWTAMLPVVAEMDEADHQRLIGLAVLDDDEVLAAMIRAAHEADLWHQLLPLVARMNASTQQRAAAVAERQGPAVVERLTRSLHELAAAQTS